MNQEEVIINPYLKNLNRIEFVVTRACTGRCKHCSEGEPTVVGDYIDGEMAAQIVHKLCENFQIESLMTFGGEPLLRLNELCEIHAAALESQIPKRQLITNGFFSNQLDQIKDAAKKLVLSGINDILLSVDAFHQEAIPLSTVKDFAKAVRDVGIPVRIHPAWLVSKEDENPYNQRTREILEEFERLDFFVSDGNIVFPRGNAVKYLGKYFSPKQKYINPYDQDPENICSICIDANGDVLDGNIYQNDILELIEQYVPEKK